MTFTFLILILLQILNIFLIERFIKFATQKHLYAIGDENNLHDGLTPRGAGVVFGTIYILSITLGFIENYISIEFWLLLFWGSGSCLILGFVDDIYDLKISTKLFFQLLIIIPLSLYFIYKVNFDYSSIEKIFRLTVLIIFLIWALNAYNFLDGADGHLTSVSCMQCILLLIVQLINKNYGLLFPIFLLLLLLFGFLKFNWPPARVFMGDAGSLFLGINFIIFTLIFIDESILNPWLILIIFSYFFIDTMGTLFSRLILKKKWNVRHTSHPYQNFSKVYSHSKMSKYLIIYHLIWLCPLLVLANHYTSYAMFLSLLSTIPSIIFLIKFGPFDSSL